MAIRNVQLYDSAVTTAKISADTVIPADVDETAAFYFSNTGSTFGSVKGTLQVAAIQIAVAEGSTTTTAAWNVSTTGGTFSGTPKTSLAQVITSVVDTPSLTTVSTSSVVLSISAAAASTWNIIGVYGF